jgi:hypothetical protein
MMKLLPELENQTESIVIVRSKVFENADPRVWKPFYKRIVALSRLKGPPLARGLPGFGWSHFDGKRFDDGYSFVALEFLDLQSRDEFVARLGRVPSVRTRIVNKREWFSCCWMKW